MSDGTKNLPISLPKLVGGLWLGSALILSAGTAAAAGIDSQDFSQVERGHYLSIVGDCAACHTLPGSGHDLAGGRAIETPFGELIAPNITPDPLTGIGAWTDQEFINSLTKGTGRNGSHLYPAMPYNYYTKVTREDALAIRAYLNTVPAVQNAVNPNQLPFPLDIRASMLVWNRLFFTPGTFRPDPNKSAEWNRGAYLTEGLGHCGACHTPKNFLGGDKTGERLRGYTLQGWVAPDITNDQRRGLGGWSVDEVATYLKTGHSRTGAATGLMSETVGNSTSHLSDTDLKAIATYLKNQPGQGDNQKQDAPVASSSPIMNTGGKIYGDECAGCHISNGRGVAGLFPALDGSSVVQQIDPTSLLHVVLRGTRGVATQVAPTGAAMPQFGWLLNDDQVAAVLTYIRNSWGNAAPAVSASEVGKARLSFVERSD
jgi:mono/diheme cytochrome c family protein